MRDVDDATDDGLVGLVLLQQLNSLIPFLPNRLLLLLLLLKCAQESLDKT